MIEGILGTKLGMTQIFEADGTVHDVTAVAVGPCVVTQVRTPAKDGYEAVQLGFGEAKRLTKPARGHLKGLGEFRHLQEFKVSSLEEVEVGQQLGAEQFEAGELVDVVGISRGRGFAGGVKRHGFHGGPKTHGQSDRHRAPGSIGSGTDPGRVVKGTPMAGHMGAKQITTRNLRVLRSNPDRGVILIEGSIPGPKGGLVRVRHAKKVSKIGS
jgi:large subunit ribosomal protein L3